MCSVVPLLGISAAFLFSSVGKLTTLGQKLYAEAGSVAEQAISSIRTVAAFTGERREADRYVKRDGGREGVQEAHMCEYIEDRQRMITHVSFPPSLPPSLFHLGIRSSYSRLRPSA
jgi:ABC-type multidrug transport system fused ATPase/permease subunit